MKEQEIIEVLKKEHEEFKKLREEHRNLDVLLSKIDSRRYLSPDEEMERKRLQKEKLLKKDMMAAIVREFQGNSNNVTR